ALVFDFTNGFHDAANSIATIVSTKVLTPFTAVLWAALFNFVAFFVFREHKVAGTIASIVDSHLINYHLILAATIAAISWNLLTWYYGIPSSSSHTLIGGLVGAAVAAGGFHGVNSAPIVKTMGTRITKVTPLEGVCAEGAGAITLYLTIMLGIPVSTTHTLTGAIVGVGAIKRISAVRWGVTVNLLWAWVLTIPLSGLLA